MPGWLPFDPLFAVTLAATMLAAQPSSDQHEGKRQRLEQERRELSSNIEDPQWMQDQGRATLARLGVERGWRECAENEAGALAKASEKPPRLLAEAALTSCREWEELLRLALDKGAYPYLEGPLSKDDMILRAELESRDGALARIAMWRSGGGSSPEADRPEQGREIAAPRPETRAPAFAPLPPPSAGKAEPPATDEGAADAETIVVTGTRVGGCRVRLADRTLTERQLAARAKEWAANGTPLRVIRPARADYHCLARIVWSLSKYGVTLFHFVEPSEAR